jgi:hypothetical protein
MQFVGSGLRTPAVVKVEAELISSHVGEWRIISVTVQWAIVPVDVICRHVLGLYVLGVAGCHLDAGGVDLKMVVVTDVGIGIDVPISRPATFDIGITDVNAG